MRDQPRIMLVEDDTDLAGLYKMRMEAEGFRVLHCPNGEVALQMAKKFQPHLIMLDLMMPRLSGFDVLDILKNTPELQNVKIIILSAMSQSEDIEKAKELGADDYLVKSQVVVADVMNRIRTTLGLPPGPTENA